MAAAERIRDLRVAAAGQLDQEDEEILGLHLVEDVLWGYDVNLTATHMAASILGMLSPATRFQRMNVHRTLLGIFAGVPYLGSIDFLDGQARLAAWPTITQQVESGEETPPPPLMDLVIMNPPFTRDSLRSLDTLRSLPVPDFRAVDSERMTLLGRAFDQLQDKTLQPFPRWMSTRPDSRSTTWWPRYSGWTLSGLIGFAESSPGNRR